MTLISLATADGHFTFDQILIVSFVVSTILISVSIVILVFQSQKAGISHFDGPWLARYTDIWSFWTAWKYEWGDDEPQERLRAKYGSVIRTGPQTLTVMDPDAVPIIYGIRAKLDKSEAYLPFRQAGVKTSLLSIQDEGMHSQYRRLVANAYSMSSVKGYEPNIDDVVQRLVDICNRYAETGESMNIGLWLQFYCFDFVSKISISKSLGCLEGQDQEASKLLKVIKKFITYVSLFSHMPWIHRIFIEGRFARKPKPYPFLSIFHTTVAERLQKPNFEEKGHHDILSYFMVTHAKNPEMMTDRQVLISTSGNFFAGSVTPGIAFQWLCSHLSINSEIQDKLHQELVQAGVSTPIPSYDQVKDLVYLDSVIREAFRLHSSTSFDLQRITGSDGLQLPDGRHVPSGIQIGCPVGIINKAESIFGNDAADFRPERWMQGKEESVEAYERRRNLMERTELSFGQGSRSCIGKNVAIFEFFKAMSALMLSFKFTQVRQTNREDVWVTIKRRGPY